jgi:peptidoglycan/LPS O-acetylase OafA/YrhL
VPSVGVAAVVMRRIAAKDRRRARVRAALPAAGVHALTLRSSRTGFQRASPASSQPLTLNVRRRSMKLSTYSSQGRDNNFNLIRMVAALAVLVTHSFALAIGTGDAEPFRGTLGMTMGSIAVDVFFITSGFLVTSSLLNRQSIIEFIWARALRIFPALLMMLFLTVFLLGVLFTSLPIPTYLSSSETYIYLAKCATLFMGVAYNLPGVFDNNPYKNAVNGSLWTLPHEVRMYAILALVWFALRIAPKFQLIGFKVIVVTFSLVAGIYILAGHFYFHYESKFAKLFFMFFVGATFYILREYIVLSRWLFWFLVILLTVATSNKHAFFVVYVFAIAYILFYLAYVPSGLIRKYNQLGDYSYGIYIYAFPVQQSVAALIPGVSVSQMILISATYTLLFATLSWHILERRSLELKANYIGHTRKLLAFCLTRRSRGTAQKRAAP